VNKVDLRKINSNLEDSDLRAIKYSTVGAKLFRVADWGPEMNPCLWRRRRANQYEDRGMQHTRVTGTTFMSDANARSTNKPAGQPVYPILMPFPIAYFAGALVTDLVYWQTAAVMWETFSDWLITAGLIMAGFAAIAFVIDFVGGKQIRTLAWPYAVGYVLAVLLSLVNAFAHSRDGYTAVVPTGLTLSGLVVVILLFTSWVGWALKSRRHVGVGI
jgi:uncharacterized membrane protein